MRRMDQSISDIIRIHKRMDNDMILYNQELSLSDVLRDARPRGVIHVGAYIGGCLETYQNAGVEYRCWIEPYPRSYLELLQHVPESDVCLNCAVSNTDGVIDFIVTNNRQSSSILPLKKHLEYYPGIEAEKLITVQCNQIDTLIAEGYIDISKYNFLVMDIQGAEYYAVNGFIKNIEHIDFIMAEINYEELYEGCMLVKEFDQYLNVLGFTKILSTHHQGFGWGDAYYKRV